MPTVVQTFYFKDHSQNTSNPLWWLDNREHLSAFIHSSITLLFDGLIQCSQQRLKQAQLHQFFSNSTGPYCRAQLMCFIQSFRVPVFIILRYIWISSWIINAHTFGLGSISGFYYFRMIMMMMMTTRGLQEIYSNSSLLSLQINVNSGVIIIWRFLHKDQPVHRHIFYVQCQCRFAVTWRHLLAALQI